MSGSTIGGIAGGIIGFFVGGPAGAQWGFMIGSAVGAIVDPEKIEGPRLKDASNQTANDGIPRAYGYGRFPCTGNIIWRDVVKEVKNTEGGKGGPEVTTYTYTRSYAIAACKGPISGFLIIKRNGKIVYDTRPDSELIALGYTSDQISETRAAQAKFMEVATLYYGDQTGPDPTMVAVKGAGNVPNYTGTAYIVLTDDETREGEIAQYEFVVAACGERTQSDVVYARVLWDESTETGGPGDVLENGQVWMASSSTAGFVTADKFVSSGDWYWEHTSRWVRVGGSLIAHWSFGGIIRQSDSAWGLVLGEVNSTDAGVIGSGGLVSNQILIEDWYPPTTNTPRSAIIRNRLTFSEGVATWSVAVDDGDWVVAMGGTAGVFAPYGVSRGPSQDGQISSRRVWLYSVPDDFTYEIPDGALGLGATIFAEGIPIPDAPGYFIDPETGVITGPDGVSIDNCEPTLGSIVAAQCAKRNVTDVDVSELTDPVSGYRVASVTSPQQNIAGLMPAYFFDSSQFDGTIHFPKRGREPTFHIPYSELVERTDGTGIPLQWVRKQEPELLRKQTVGYIDPATTFTATTQQWERRAGTVQAQGESTLEIPVVGQADWAAQVAEKSGKVAWAESTEGSFHLTRAWAKLVTAAVGTIEDVDGSIHIIRIERIQDDGGIRMLDVRKTRASAYESTAEGAQKPLPLFPGSNIRGPTLHAVMNMPAALDQYDRPGLTWAAAGMTDGWVGARLQVLRAGEWVTLGDINTPGSVGTLASDLAAHSGDIDTANVLRIRMDDPLSSVTFTQLLNERNPVAILRDDHTVEVVQFQDAVQDSDGVWTCTTLIRGNLDTETTAHVAGATVVAMEGGIQFVDLRPDDLGKTLTFRVVSLGTDPDAAPTFDITFDYIWSSTEWPVAYLEVEKDGDDFNLSWIERRRLGTDATPIRSANWEGYAVSYEHAGGSGEVTVTDPAHTFTLPGATDVDFTVAQINRITGRGPETTVNHE